MPTLNEPLSPKVILSISCRNLKDMDDFPKSGVMAVFFQKLNNEYFELGRTEIIKNNINPIFLKIFEIDCHFEERQLFKVEIYDSDCSSARLDVHNFLGRYEFTFGELIGRKFIKANLIEHQSKTDKIPMVLIICMEVDYSKKLSILQSSDAKFDKIDTFEKSDPLLEVYRYNEPIRFMKGDSNINNYNWSKDVFQDLKSVQIFSNKPVRSFGVELQLTDTDDTDDTDDPYATEAYWIRTYQVLVGEFNALTEENEKMSKSVLKWARISDQREMQSMHLEAHIEIMEEEYAILSKLLFNYLATEPK